MAYENAIKPNYRPLAMKAWARMGIMMATNKLPQTPALVRPFIQITHEDGGHIGCAVVDLSQHGSHLLAPPKAGQVEMHADNAYILPLGPDIGNNSASRFKSRQVHNIMG